MSNEEYIKRAIEKFHLGKSGLPKPGSVIAHVDDPYAYEVRSVDDDTVTGFFIDENGQEHTASFLVNEVFNPGSVARIAQELKMKHDLGELLGSNINVEGGLYEF